MEVTGEEGGGNQNVPPEAPEVEIWLRGFQLNNADTVVHKFVTVNSVSNLQSLRGLTDPEIEEELLKGLQLADRGTLRDAIRTLKTLAKTPSETVPDYFYKGIPPYHMGHHSGDSGSSVPSNHEAVTLINADLFDTLMSLQPDVYVTECRLWQRRTTPLLINTEFDAAHCVSSILDDAIYAAKLKLRLSAEVTLSSRFRTDFLVLRQNGLPVGVIEVKKPKMWDLRDHPEIFGELFDYMMFLKSTYNIQRVLGILTRYSDWYVCWLEDTPSPASSSSSSSPSPMSLTPTRYTQEIAPCTPSPFPIPFESDCPPTENGSPPAQTPSQHQSFDLFEPSPPENPLSFDDKIRSMCVSQKFNRDDPGLWRMIITVLIAMSNTIVVESAVPCYRYVALVGEKIDGFQWHPVKGDGVWLSDLNFKTFPHKNTTTFHIWESLGCGVSGRAFLATSSSSRAVCVIKCFFSGPKDQTKEDKVASREKFQTHEYNCWKGVYPNYPCLKKTVFQRPAILMQYFSFIRVGDRRDLLGAVKETLQKDYDKKGWVHHDVKWRNIGQDHKRKVVVFDMGSVKQKTSVDEKWVDCAMTELEKWCGP